MNSAPKPRPTIATRTLLSDICFLLTVSRFPLPASGFRLPASGFRRTVYRLPSTVYRLPSTVYRLPFTVYRLLPPAPAAARRDDVEHAVHRPPVRRERADVRVLPRCGRRPELRRDRLA